MEHCLVFTVFAEECYVFAEIHVFKMIRDKAAVATLNAFAEFLQIFFFYVIVHRHFEILSDRLKSNLDLNELEFIPR